MRNGDYIGTYTGKKFWPLDPKPEEICLEDIAHALSNICRFNGHCKRFYSVLEHSLNVAKRLKDMNSSPGTILFGLLHDAAEAYVCDIPRPLKRYLADYKAIEDNVQSAIYKHFNLGEPDRLQKATICEVDNYILALESRELMLNIEGWNLVPVKQDDRLLVWCDVCGTWLTEVNNLLTIIQTTKEYSSDK